MKLYIAHISNSSNDILFRSSNRHMAKRDALDYARSLVCEGGYINVSIFDEDDRCYYISKVSRKNNKFHYYVLKNF